MKIGIRRISEKFMNTFEVIYEDDTIIVCYKPAEIATQTKRLGQQDMESLLKNYRAKKKEQPYIGVVHRLDQPVEGVMVFAKTQKAAAELSKQVQQRSIGKKYYAVGVKQKLPVMGNGAYVTLTDYMTFDQRKNIGQIVSKDTKDAKKAELEYRICGEKDDLVMLDITLHTGRHHQIRLQMANEGYPLVGDQKYGVVLDGISEENGDGAVTGGIKVASRVSVAKQLALCSYSLEFKHPVTKKNMKFEIEPKNGIFQKVMII